LVMTSPYDGLFEGTDAPPYIICDMDGILVPFFIESYRPRGAASLLVKLEYVDDERAARRFVHRTVYYPIDRLPENDSEGADDPAWECFVGYQLTDAAGREVGRVTAVDASTANVLFRVDREGHELLIPVASEVMHGVDHAARRIAVAVPEGLLDLN
jgi:ribosome maturation factor rimM